MKIQGGVLYQLTAALSRSRWQRGERDAPGAWLIPFTLHIICIRLRPHLTLQLWVTLHSFEMVLSGSSCVITSRVYLQLKVLSNPLIFDSLCARRPDEALPFECYIVVKRVWRAFQGNVWKSHRGSIKECFGKEECDIVDFGFWFKMNEYIWD